MIILCDLDHTVSDAFWRDTMIGSVPWDEYHDNLKFDKPFQNMVYLINSLSSVGYIVIGITGRTEKHRQITIDWLIKFKIDIDTILMRPDDCFIKNWEMKIKLAQDHLKDDLKKVHFLIDDNEETILAFNKLGIATLQVRNIK
jgi:hypothetical protein